MSGPSHVHSGSLLPADLGLSDAKRRLYEVALALFGDVGYHAVSLRDIADTLGVKSSAIYAHVESKLDILFDLATIGQQMHFDALRAALLDAGREPTDQLRAVVGAHLDHHLDFPAISRVVHREMRVLDPGQLEAVLVVRRQAEQLLVDVLDRGVRLGEFDIRDTLLAGRAIGGMAVRIPEWRSLDGDTRSPAEIREHYVEYALRLAGVR